MIMFVNNVINKGTFHKNFQRLKINATQSIIEKANFFKILQKLILLIFSAFSK